MNKKGQWNIGIGTALIIGGVYILTRENIVTSTAFLGIILIGAGVWLVFH